MLAPNQVSKHTPRDPNARLSMPRLRLQQPPIPTPASIPMTLLDDPAGGRGGDTYAS